MNERRRPPRRGRGPRPQSRPPSDAPAGEENPYRDASESVRPAAGVHDNGDVPPAAEPRPAPTVRSEVESEGGPSVRDDLRPEPRPEPRFDGRENRPNGRPDEGRGGEGRPDGRGDGRQGGRPEGRGDNQRRNRRNRGRGPRPERQERPAMATIVADTEVTGWFDAARDGGYIRKPASSYLAEAGDAFVPAHLAKQFFLRRGDAIVGSAGRDPRGRVTVVDIQQINGGDPALAARRPDFSSLTASYPERKLFLETGKPAKGGPELTRRAIDLIAPIGFGQRALIVAPARAGKTMLLQAITEGVAVNHPEAVLLVLLVDERPEEVSEMITWGYGEVIASSFDMPAERHTDVTEIVLERARRLVEMGKDVVIVLDSITRMARAYNTVERGTGRTLSGGLDATAMAKPKAFFGSARSVAPQHGGGSLTIIATALVETGSRMDDVIFEEFKGTGNSEIKLDRSLAEKRIFPAIDIATSGTRREEKLFRPDQLDAVYTLRRGLQQMPSSSAMEWLIKRIAGTQNNDALLSGL